MSRKPASKPVTQKEIKDAMAVLRSIKTEARTNASRANAAKAAEARRIDPLSLPCVCSGGDSLKPEDHKTTCPRGRLLWQRKRAAEKKAAQEQGAQNVS